MSMKRRALLRTLMMATMITGSAGMSSADDGETQLLWGDTHLHTSRSFDAFLFGNINATPDVAYRFAKGLPVVHPGSGARVQLDRPLDFLVVADHAELQDVPKGLIHGDERLTGTEAGQHLSQMMQEGRHQEAFREIVAAMNKGEREVVGALASAEMRKGSWLEVVDAAEAHNEPGTFTAFSGWEWSSTPDGANLHRVVFTSSDADTARKFVPFSAIDSVKPEALWAWLEATKAATGADFIAIPHNSNISKGLMFDSVDSEGRPITAEYARTRAKWEPVAEVTQIKGDSETHPDLSPTDEFADFEYFKFLLDTRGANGIPATNLPGDYLRSALGRGMEIEAVVGVNPYKLGMVGSTDAHTGLSTADEDNFQGKAVIDSITSRKGNPFAGQNFLTGWDMSASGLAAVWASENSREAIAAAFKRKEVYATTGTRIALRMFAGFDFRAADARARNLAATGYKKGVPMGGDLTAAPKGKPVTLLLQAVKDPRGANLDRLQVIKGWLGKDGKAHEKVFDVAWSDGRKKGADGKLPPVGNTVDMATARYDNRIGATEFAAVWSDPEFDPETRAFYYVRVIEIPTPRHTLYDTIALNVPPETSGHPATIQERAYSSPVWYTP
ncbi:DUF3604 domain-containing protein [Pseudokordiimonas caeni]|uniref:DUF3604 domain-containing protein n=1 Tax=Pseudokordiimonas caeni TaxID=2997908 RepID=UPI0028112A56|nr:DUF3604 domain-containing protein [Pseudokordiimonas caeni]